MLTIYRIVYAGVIVILLGNLLRAHYLAWAPRHVFVLAVAFAVSLCCLLVLLVGFSRIPPTAFWAFITMCEGLFIWYAWFSPGSPFALHETHSLDATAAAREHTMHSLAAWSFFAGLFAWLLSLPMVRWIHGQRGASRT